MSIKIEGVFVKSAASILDCPKQNLPEYAFIGRSNVGKSSLINMLFNHKGLAKTSGTPGKTKLINYFLANNAWYLVDLPGYGYAKVSKKDRAKWIKETKNYLEKRERLMCTFVLVDARLEPQKNDTDFMYWMAQKRIPFVIVFTKHDKLSSREWGKNKAKYVKKLKVFFDGLPNIFTTSSITSYGREELLQYIDDLNQLFKTETQN